MSREDFEEYVYGIEAEHRDMPADQLIWESTIYAEIDRDTELYREKLVSLGIDCDACKIDHPKVGQISFVYRICTSIEKYEELITQIGDLYEIEAGFRLRGATYAFYTAVGVNLP